jgi:hypothetical protein
MRKPLGGRLCCVGMLEFIKDTVPLYRSESQGLVSPRDSVRLQEVSTKRGSAMLDGQVGSTSQPNADRLCVKGKAIESCSRNCGTAAIPSGRRLNFEAFLKARRFLARLLAILWVF